MRFNQRPLIYHTSFSSSAGVCVPSLSSLYFLSITWFISAEESVSRAISHRSLCVALTDPLHLTAPVWRLLAQRWHLIDGCPNCNYSASLSLAWCEHKRAAGWERDIQAVRWTAARLLPLISPCSPFTSTQNPSTHSTYQILYFFGLLEICFGRKSSRYSDASSASKLMTNARLCLVYWFQWGRLVSLFVFVFCLHVNVTLLLRLRGAVSDFACQCFSLYLQILYFIFIKTASSVIILLTIIIKIGSISWV